MDDVLITWLDFKKFFDENHWNWSALINSNILSILFQFGFVLSSTISPQNISNGNLNDLFKVLHQFSNTKIVFDNEMLSYLKKIQNFQTNKSDSEISKLDQNEVVIPVFVEKKIISPLIKIWNNIHENTSKYISSKTYADYFNCRFFELDDLLKNTFDELKNKPKKPLSNKDIEINERIFISGIITQTSLSSADLFITKIRMENTKLNCSIIASISIQQQTKIPLGMVLGVIGKVIDITLLSNNKLQLVISAENWFFPNILPPSKKPIPKTTNESWVVVIGSIYFSQKNNFSLLLMKEFIKWIQASHENFRIRYCIFSGGIIGENEQLTKNASKYFPLSEELTYESEYLAFNAYLEKIPPNIETFIVPSPFDFANQYLPQPCIAKDYQSKKKNIHYLDNPNVISVEEKNILLYNPYQFFSFDPFLTQPEKFTIDLINFRHLAPVWFEEHNVIYPYSKDCLILPNDIDFIIIQHPNQNFLSSYKNINILGISMNSEGILNEFSVIVCNLHTQERKVIKIKIS